MPMSRQPLHTALDEVARVASLSRWGRLLVSPYRYVSAIAFRELVYGRNRREKQVTAATFFGREMRLLLPSSTDIYLTGGKSHGSEVRLARFMLEHLPPGGTFVDIGAHYGYFTLLASELVGASGTVAALEASPATYRILASNTDALANTLGYNLAASDSDTQLSFYEFPTLYSEYNSLDVDQFRGETWFEKNAPTEVRVGSTQLDAFVAERGLGPDIVKIDVEGAEFRVINGFREYLSSHSPYVVMEYVSEARGNAEHANAERLLLSLGYRAYLIDERGHFRQTQDVREHIRASGEESDNVVFARPASLPVTA